MSIARLVIAILLIALGLLFLAGNLGLLDWDYIGQLWRLWQLWPLLLIILGIALFFGRRQRGVAIGLIVLTVLLGLVLAAFAIEGRGTTIVEDSFTGPPVGDIERATLLGRLGATRLDIAGGAERVVEAGFRTAGQVIVSDTGPDASYEVEFAQPANRIEIPFFRPGGRQTFDIRLSSEIPWDIDLDVGAADARLDLRTVRVRSLQLDAGASSVRVRLGPETEDGAEVRIEGGAASFNLELSRELDITVRATGGLASRNFADGFEERGDDLWVYEGGGPAVSIDLRAGVSSINVRLE
jgi:hypothetical protein